MILLGHRTHCIEDQVNISHAAANSLQSCPTLCDPTDGSPPGSPIPGILQARTLEWVAISFSNAWQWKVKGNLLSRIRLLATPWTAAYQAPPSMGFSRQEYWSGVPLPSPFVVHDLANIWQYRKHYISSIILCVWINKELPQLLWLQLTWRKKSRREFWELLSAQS